jgi:hypothetical protein
LPLLVYFFFECVPAKKAVYRKFQVNPIQKLKNDNLPGITKKGGNHPLLASEASMKNMGKYLRK